MNTSKTNPSYTSDGAAMGTGMIFGGIAIGAFIWVTWCLLHWHWDIIFNTFLGLIFSMTCLMLDIGFGLLWWSLTVRVERPDHWIKEGELLGPLRGIPVNILRTVLGLLFVA